MLKEFTSITELHSAWKSLLPIADINTLFTSPEWEDLWWKHFADGKSWKGLYLETGSQVVGIAPLCITDDTLTLLGNTETVDYNDFVVSLQHSEEFLNLILEYFMGSVCNSLSLNSIQSNSQTYIKLPELALGKGLHVVVEEEDVSPGIRLPQSWDIYLENLNKKHRHELRRKLRRLDTVEDCKIEVIDTTTNLEKYVHEFTELMKMSKTEKMDYLTQEKKAFFNSLSAMTAELGVLKLFLMSIGEQYVSASLCFDYDNHRLLYNSGNNHDFDYYSVGLLLHSFAIKDAIENGLEYFDFLRGNEQYKYRLGGVDKTVYSIKVTK